MRINREGWLFQGAAFPVTGVIFRIVPLFGTDFKIAQVLGTNGAVISYPQARF